MNTDLHRTSAKIYQFPSGGRIAPAPRAAAQPAQRACVVGSSWYHDAAIQEEAERNRTPRR